MSDTSQRAIDSLQKQVDAAMRLRREAREEVNMLRDQLFEMDRAAGWRKRCPNANSAVSAALGAAVMLLIVLGVAP